MKQIQQQSAVTTPLSIISMLHIICLTKTYNKKDLECWLKWHSAAGAHIILLDNESPCDLSDLIPEYVNTYRRFTGFPDQWRLFNRILNGEDGLIKFKEDDLIAFIDDDEYLWWDKDKFGTLEDALRVCFRQLGVLLIPEILMSTHHLMQGRRDVLPNLCYYRRPDTSSQGKSVIMYEPWSTYSFNLHPEEIGHVPWVNNIRMSDVVGSAVSKTTYGLTAYNAPVRLYHYHIKSEADWKIKIERGSAAAQAELGKNGSYDADIRKNVKFGNYDVPDFTMKTALENLERNLSTSNLQSV